MDLMRERGSGWVHARLVDGKMVVLLAQQFKKEGGKILLARRLKKAVACGGDEAVACGGDEAAGCGYVVEYGDEAEGVVDDAELLEEDKVDNVHFTFRTQSLVHTPIMHRERVHSQLQLSPLIWVQCRAHLILMTGRIQK